MSRDITVSDDLYERLHNQAARQGKTIESYLEELSASSETLKTEVLARLHAKGLLVTWPGPAPAVSDHPPIVVKGAPLSRTIIEDRR